MKKITTFIVFLISLNLAHTNNPCTECCNDFTITAPGIIPKTDSCVITAIAGWPDGQHYWYLYDENGTPLFTTIGSSTITFVLPGPGIYEIRHRAFCWPGMDKEKIEFEVTCQDCPIPEDDISFTYELVGSSGVFSDLACSYEFTAVNNTGLGIISYNWSFQNGTPSASTAASPIVSFPDETLSEVCLELYLEGECYAEYCDTIYPDCEPPCDPELCEDESCEAEFDILYGHGCQVFFTDQSTPTPGTTLTYYSLSSPDDPGFSFSGTGSFGTIAYQFPASGIYRVRLAILDGVYCYHETWHYVEVSCGHGGNYCDIVGPSAYAYATNPGEDCYSVIVNDLSSWNPPCEIVRWYLDYGDGTLVEYTSNLPGTFLHTYVESGAYEVCLYVEDECGCTDQYCMNVTIDCDVECQADFDLLPGGCESIACHGNSYGYCHNCFQDLSTPSTCAQIIGRKWEVIRQGSAPVTEYDVEKFKFCSFYQNEPVKVCLTIFDSRCCESKVCKDYIICPGGLSDPGSDLEFSVANDAVEEVRIFPNPASGQFTVSATHTLESIQSVRIYDIQGRVVYRADGLSLSAINISTENMSNGVYVVETLLGDRTVKDKIIVAK